MILKENPFYLLKQSCKVGTSEVLALASKMRNLSDSEDWPSALQQLLDPSERLSAETDWFVDCDEDKIAQIRVQIDHGAPIVTDGLSTLSALNATVYNFSVSNSTDAFEVGFSVMEIDELFSAVDILGITEAINKNRAVAGIVSVQMSDVKNEMTRKRQEIVQIITRKISDLDRISYTELIRGLKEKQSTEGSSIMSNVVEKAAAKFQGAQASASVPSPTIFQNDQKTNQHNAETKPSIDFNVIKPQNTQQKKKQKSKKQSYSVPSENSGCLNRILVFIAFAAIIILISLAFPSRKASDQPEVEYSSSCIVGDNVYANIVLIEPGYGIYSIKQYGSVTSTTRYTEYVCKCTTDIGDTVWICFGANEYINKIDSTVGVYVKNEENESGGKRVRFNPAAKIHGEVVKSTSIIDDLFFKINQNKVIKCSSVAVPEQAAQKKLTVQIKSIFPTYTITSGKNKTVTHVLCEFTNTSGKKNWIYMTVNEYQYYFDASAKPATDEYASEVSFKTARNVTVTVSNVDDLIDGASESIGQNTVYVLESVN